MQNTAVRRGLFLVSWAGSFKQRTIEMVLRGYLDTGLLCKYVGKNLAPSKVD